MSFLSLNLFNLFEESPFLQEPIYKYLSLSLDLKFLSSDKFLSLSLYQKVLKTNLQVLSLSSEF